MNLRTLGTLDGTSEFVALLDEQFRIHAVNAWAAAFLGLDDSVSGPVPWHAADSWMYMFPDGLNEHLETIIATGAWAGRMVMTGPTGERLPATAAVVRCEFFESETMYLTVARPGWSPGTEHPYLAVDETGVIVGTGPAIRAMLGLDELTVLDGLSADAIVPGVSVVEERLGLRAVRADGAVRYFDVIPHPKDDGTTWLMMSDVTASIVTTRAVEHTRALLERVVTGDDTSLVLEDLTTILGTELGLQVGVAVSVRGVGVKVLSAGPRRYRVPEVGDPEPFGEPVWRTFRRSFGDDSEAIVALIAKDLAPFVQTVAEDAARVAGVAAGRERLVADLASSEKQVDELFGSVHELTMIIDQEGRFTFASPAFEHVLGWAPSRLGGTFVIDLLHPEDRATVVDELTELFATSPATASRMNANRVVRVRDSSGGYHSMESFVADRREDPRVRAFVIHARDVTAEVMAAQALEAERNELRATQARLRALLARQSAMVEEDRLRWSQRLHDDAMQSMAAAEWRAGDLIERVGNADDPELVANLTLIKDALAKATSAAQELMFDTRPPVLDRVGLAAAVREQLERFGESEGWAVTFASETDGLELPETLRMLVFRTTQEALRNAAKHAKASKVAIGVGVRALEGSRMLDVEISDDGVGVTADVLRAAEASGHFGVVSMREAVLMAGGRFEVRSQDAGTTVHFVVPVPDGSTDPLAEEGDDPSLM